MAQQLTPQLLEHSPRASSSSSPTRSTSSPSPPLNPSTRHRDGSFGSGTVLDSGRFRFLIGQRAGVAVGNVHGVIVGERRDSEISLWSSVSIGGVPAEQFRSQGALVFDEVTRERVSAEVVNAAYEIIEGKGATNLAISLSTARIIEAVLGNQHRVLLVSAAGAGAVLQAPMAVNELLGLQASAAMLRAAQESLQL